MEKVTQPFGSIRFLIIEDEVEQALLLGQIIRDLGGVVSGTAYGYDQARSAINEQVFDCAILDINLRGTLSFRLLEMLNERKIPFVICTAYSDGIDAYPPASAILRLDKPVQSTKSRDAFHSILNEAATPASKN